jgi:predicted HTH transcriptional regulator/septal ring factor EnvC (AmiA/AmiB activator)
MIRLEDIVTSKENSHWEAKKAHGGLPESLWETYSAFANTEGGIVLLGVSENRSNQLTVTGITDAQEKVKNLWNLLNNRQKVSANILFERHIYIQSFDGKEIIVIEVPRADRHDKPIYINNDLLKGTFRRNADGDYHCSEAEIKSMLRDQSDLPLDSKIVDELNWRDLDSDAITRYRNRFASLKPSHIWNGLETNIFLQKIGAVKKNESGTLKPTFAGLLAFGTEDVITQILPDYFLDYREKYDSRRWSDRVVSNLGEWSGNVFDFFFKVAGKLTADIKIPFQFRNPIERMNDTSVHVAMREALANALIHADYHGKRGIVIEKEQQTVTIANPGILRVGIEEAMDGGVSDPRNPTLFKIFALIDIGERAGSGLFNIKTVWENTAWMEPTLKEFFNPERTILHLPIELLETGDKSSKTGDKSDMTGDKLSEAGDKSNETGDKLNVTGDKLNMTGDKLNMTGDKLNMTGDKLYKTGDKLNETGDKLDMTGDKLNETGDKLSMTGDKSDMTGDKLYKTGDKLNETGDKSDMTGDKLDMTGDKSDKTGDKSDKSGDKLNKTGDKSDKTGDKSDKTGDKLNKTGDKLNMTGDKSDMTGDKLSKTGDKLNETSDKLDVTGDKSDVTGDKLDMTGDKLNMTGDKSDETGDKLSMTGDKSDETGDKLNETGDKSDKTGDKLNVTGDKSDMTGDKLDKTGDKLDKTGDKLSKTGDKSDKTGDKSDKTGDKLDVTGEKLNMTGEKSDVTGNKLNETGDKSNVTGDKLDKTGDKLNVTGDKLNETGDKLDMTGDKLDKTGDKLNMTGDKLDKTGDKLNVTGDKLSVTGDKLSVTSNKSGMTGDKLDMTGDKLNKTGDKLDVTGDKLDMTGDKLDKTGDKLIDKQNLQEFIINHIRQHGRVRNIDIVTNTKLSYSWVRQVLTEMVASQRLTPHGANKNRYYTLLSD